MKKSILKRVVCIVILVGLVIGAIWGWKYYENQKRKKQNAYFTNKKITASEIGVMVDYYHVKSTPEFPWELDEEDWPDYSYYTIESTEDTEKVVTVLNYELANELYSTEQEAVELFKEYGFSKEKPMTVEWIMDNPQKAVIEIPDTAKYKAKSMADGYEQISYKWNDGTYKYEVRWHTRTSGAPEGQGNTWVIQRIILENGGHWKE